MVADAQSRTPTIAAVLSPEIDYRQLAADQATLDAIHAYRIAITVKLEDVPFQDFTVLCDISLAIYGQLFLMSGGDASSKPFTDSHMPVTALLSELSRVSLSGTK